MFERNSLKAVITEWYIYWIKLRLLINGALNFGLWKETIRFANGWLVFDISRIFLLKVNGKIIKIKIDITKAITPPNLSFIIEKVI